MDSGHVSGRRGGLVLNQARVFDAPVERVFELLTEPTELAEWWGPHGFSTPKIRIDLRVGGGFRFTMQPPEGDPFHLSGEFLVIRAPTRLRYTFRWDEPVPDDRETVVELSLDPLGRTTQLTLSHGEFATEERLNLHRGGWADSFEKLDAVLKAREA